MLNSICVVFVVFFSGCTRVESSSSWFSISDEKVNGTLIETDTSGNIIHTFPAPNNYTFTFTHGQSAMFFCRKFAGSYVKLTHYSQGTPRSTDYQAIFGVNMYMKLTKDYNDTVLECVTTDDKMVTKQVVTLKFILKMDDRVKETSFKVNDLILPKFNDTSYYEYYNGESLSVSVVTDKKSYVDMTCGIYSSNSPPELFYRLENNPQVRTTDVLPFTIYKDQFVRLSCTYKIKTTREKKTMDLLLTHFDQAVHNEIFGPYVKGLSLSNILFKYSYSSEMRINSIHYSVRNKTVDLECGTSNLERPTKWIYNHHEVTAIIISKQGISFSLTNNVNSARVICQELSHIKNNKKIYLDLYRETYNPLTISRVITPEATHPPEFYVNLEKNQKSKNSTDSSTMEAPTGAMAVGITSALIVGGVLTVLSIMAWRRWKRIRGRVPGNVSTSRRQGDPDSRSFTSSLYETIPEELPKEETAGSHRTIDMSQRPPCPLPQEACEENRPYLHYDTVYEQRVFRVGRNGPILQIPDRTRPI